METAASDARDDAAGRIAALHAAVDALGSAGFADGCAAGFAGGGAAAPCGLADDTLVAVAVAGERLLRCVEGLVVEVAGEVAARSARELGDDRLTVKHGCADAVSLLANLTGVSKRTAALRVKLGTAVRASTSSLGVAGPGRFPEVLAALREGRVGTDAARNITRVLTDSARRVGYSADLAECERMLVIAADQNTTPDGDVGEE